MTLPPEGISPQAWDEAQSLALAYVEWLPTEGHTTLFPPEAEHVLAQTIARAIMAATERAAVAGDSLANDIQASAEEMRGEMRVHRLRRAAGIRHLVSILRNPAALAERVEAATREPQNDNFKSVPHNGEIG